LKILLIGLGAIGQRHGRNLRTLLGDDAQFLAWRTQRSVPALAADMSVRPNVDLEIEYSIQAFDDLDEALAQQPQIAVIANPTSLHIPTALRCARAGCDLFLEKPLSDSLDGVEELIEIVAQKKLVAIVGYPLRAHPACRLVKQLLDENAIGTLLHARIAFGESLPDWHPYEDYRRSYAARRELGGGVVLTQIHDLDLALWFFGMPQRVLAFGGQWSDLEIDVEDAVSALFEYSISTPQGERVFPLHLQQDYVQKPPRREFEIVGSQGMIRLDFPKLRVEQTSFSDDQTRVHEFAGFERNTLFLNQMRDFLDCVRDRKTPDISIEEGARSLQIALATRRSLESRSVEVI